MCVPRRPPTLLHQLPLLGARAVPASNFDELRLSPPEHSRCRKGPGRQDQAAQSRSRGWPRRVACHDPRARRPSDACVCARARCPSPPGLPPQNAVCRVARKRQMLIPLSSGGWESTVEAPADSVSGGAHPLARRRLSSPDPRQKGRGSFLGFFFFTPFMGAPAPWPSRSPRAPLTLPQTDAGGRHGPALVLDFLSTRDSLSPSVLTLRAWSKSVVAWGSCGLGNQGRRTRRLGTTPPSSRA